MRPDEVPHDPAMPGAPADSPSEERRVDGESRTRIAAIEERFAAIDQRYRRVARAALIGQLITGVACIAALTVGIVVLREQRDRGKATAELAQFAATLATRIDAERRANIVRSCRESAQANERTIAKLDELLAKRATDPDTTDAERTRLKESRDGTVALINRLRPPPGKGGCERLADEQVKPKRQPAAAQGDR